MIITTSPKNKQLLGENNKALNKRVLATVDLNDSILVVDLQYYSSLIANKLKHNSSFRRNWADLERGGNGREALKAVNDTFEPISKLKSLVKIKSIIFLYSSKNSLSKLELDVLKLSSGILQGYLESSNIVSGLYSLAVKEKGKYLILTNKLDFWSICSQQSNIHHCIVGKNNAIKLYTDKFGLEYLSSIIGTNKLVNKLRLSKLKYVNLQYLFLLLLYIKFKTSKSNQEDLDFSKPGITGATGKGLLLLMSAHREISYYFLTKKDMMDIFLTSSATHFTLNLSRLLKITDFDIRLMSGFANYYSSHAVKQVKIEIVPPKQVYYKIVSRAKVLQEKEITPTNKHQEKALPTSTPALDISNMDTSMAIDAILQGLSW